MRLVRQTLHLSASDLTNHLACRHLTQLNLAAVHGTLDPPEYHDPLLLVLKQRGIEHENAYTEHLQAQGEQITDLSHSDDDDDPSSAYERTQEAMRQRKPNILQATLSLEGWQGRADLLQLVNRPSKLGDWSYEVVETKLARQTRAGTILELCLYSEMVAKIQGDMPANIHVIAPQTDYKPESFRLKDCLAYYRFVRCKLEDAVSKPNSKTETYPNPVPHCDICRWRRKCDQQRRDDDHLCLVANISKLQTRELQGRKVETLDALAELTMPLKPSPNRGASEGYERIQKQARVQKQERETKEPVCEDLLLEAGRGLALLPEPSQGDVFFDIEGDTAIREGGLEFLIGYVEKNLDYKHRWAYTANEEKHAFEWFVDTIIQRWQQDPKMHIYHFGHYDPSALKRIMGRYATRETEVDSLLRSIRFVDLHNVVKQSLRASVEQYSLKEMEKFHYFQRALPLDQASLYLWGIKRALELKQQHNITEEACSAVLSYNKDDCLSAMSLRDWLEERRAKLVSEGNTIARPEVKSGKAIEEITEQQQLVDALKKRLNVQDVPSASSDKTEEEHARWLLAEMLEWHRREDKAKWWEYYRLLELSEEDLMEEKKALSGLKYNHSVGGTTTCPIHRYSYPQQDSDIRKGDVLFTRGEKQVGTVNAVDFSQNTLDIKKRGDAADFHPISVFEHKMISTTVLSTSLFNFGDWIASNGMKSANHRYRASRDLLLCRGPRLSTETPMQIEKEQPLPRALRLASALERGVLPIQGPPGSGKTHMASRMICELVKAGKKIGVTANSHKVIVKLLEEVTKAAEEKNLSIRCIKKGTKGISDNNHNILIARDSKELRTHLDSNSAQVVGDTAWLWSREDFFEAVDVLFIDEAGQMSLANVLACGQSAKSLVLLGDPQQLDQPLQGIHPKGTEVSALQHLLGEENTLSNERGLFLPKTWRLAPSVCGFISEMFYDGRLSPHEGREKQCLKGNTPFVGAGLWFLPVEHEGNQSSCLEEAQKVKEVVEALLARGGRWVNAKEEEQPLRLEDILIVAPYNAQVAEISVEMQKHAMADARVGTVDKFQGQEAPIVIYSMATSSPEEAPRGMEFLYSPHRFNVAVSRAQCACLLVCNPRLLEPDCRSPRQIRLANSFCRYRELKRM